MKNELRYSDIFFSNDHIVSIINMLVLHITKQQFYFVMLKCLVEKKILSLGFFYPESF